MTQKVRWLAALALLLAFGAGAVRAEEEEEEVRPAAHCALELLSAPRPTAAAPSQVVVAPPCLPAPPWAQFVLPNAFPCPCPVPMPPMMGNCPFAPVAMPCPSMPCPCATGFCPPGCCACALPHDAPHYVVTANMVKAGDDMEDVTACPRVAVAEGEPATIHLQGYETSNARSSLQIQMTVCRQGQGARMDLALTEASAREGCESGLHSHTETTEARCSVPFGKPYRMELKPGAWLEVTVTEEEHEERMHQAACGAACPLTKADEEECAATPMDTVGMVVTCLGQIIGDAANSAFGWAVSTDDDEELPPPSAYLEQPPQLVAPTACHLSGEAACPSCPAGCEGCRPRTESGCTPCAAAEAVQQAESRLAIDATHDRKKVEVTDGGKHLTALADRMTIHDGCIRLQGEVVVESYDESRHESVVIKADAIRLERKDGGLKIHVDDNAKTEIDE